MKKNILQLCLLCVIFLASHQTFGQVKNEKDSTTNNQTSNDDEDDDDDEEMEAVIKEKERLAKLMAADSTKKALKISRNLNSSQGGNWGLGVNLTTNGFGAEIAKSIGKSNQLNLKLGFNYLPLEINNISTDFSGTKIIGNANITLGAIGCYLDWHPFNNVFKVTGGAALMLTKMKLLAYLKDSADQGNLKVSPQEAGQINLEVKPFIIAPYIGIGLGRSIPKNRVGFSFDIGTYFIGSPDVLFNTTGLLEPTSNQESVLKNNMSGYQWLPKISININIKLSK